MNSYSHLNESTSIYPLDAPFSLGKLKDGSDLNFSLKDLANPHISFIGRSGSGKTFNICQMINQFCARGITHHIIGFHPDFDYASFEERDAISHIPSDKFLHFKFQLSNSEWSINPFIFNPAPDQGGIENAVRDIIKVFELNYKSLGDVQKGYLEQILLQVYKDKGFDPHDPTTWRHQENAPTLYDLKEEVDFILAQLRSELNESIIHNIRALKKEVTSKRSTLTNPDLNLSIDKIKSLEEEYKHSLDALSELTRKLASQLALDARGTQYFSEWNVEPVNRLGEIVDRMIRSRLYTGNPLKTKQGCINYYDLSALRPKEQETITFILLRLIYLKSMIKNRHNLNPDCPDTYIVIDEGRYISKMAKDPVSPVNEILGGSRKFGLGLMVGLQGATQMNKDMSDNIAMKFVVKCDESANNEAKKYFNLSPSEMSKLIAKQNAWIKFADRPQLVDTFR